MDARQVNGDSPDMHSFTGATIAIYIYIYIHISTIHYPLLKSVQSYRFNAGECDGSIQRSDVY